MNFFENYFYNNKDRPIHKWGHYFEIYEKHFNKFRNKKISLLEIGVGQGGSLQMWKNYFGENISIVGLDILPHCKDYEEPQIKIEIGSQYDTIVLDDLIAKYQNFDIIIDDGSHINDHVIFTFNHLFKHLNEDGVYLIEDVHTSYVESFGGGLRKKGSFVEFVKDMIDEVNMFSTDHHNAKYNYMTKYVNNINIYDSVIVFEKKFKKTIPYSIGSPGNSLPPHKNPSDNLDLNY
jgi:23S rRNA U2552 (ribose-2'-O)-methylase RlmE/FtsJ